ncbi:MAG: GntR family transcriptional regulator [Pirellulales bacterium]|nr:GntR family transcriptional regulator [Pirellulales bacterium]
MPIGLSPTEEEHLPGDRAKKPKYQRIRDHLYSEIITGKIAPGSALPTEAELCQTLGMSRNTVRQALSDLETKGIIERVQGRGTFVSTEQQRHAHQQLDMFAFIAPQLREGSYPSLIHGFENGCAKCRYQTIVGNSGNDIGRQADLILQMIDQSVGGVAIVPTTTTTPVHQIRQLQKSHIPVVFCHRTVPGTAAPSVVYSGKDAGLLAGRTLQELGHRRIAYPFVHRYSMIEDYGQGLRDAFAAEGNDPEEVIFINYGDSRLALNVQAEDAAAEDAIKMALDSLLARPDRPTAVFCGSATVAEVVYLHANAIGLKIPQDLSIIYVGSSWRPPGLARRLSGVVIDEHGIGAHAAKLLYEMQTGKRLLDNDEQIVFPSSLLPGETLGPAPRK